MAIAVPVLVLFILLLVSFVFLPAMILAVTSLILRHIGIIIPPVTHEIDRAAAGIVFMAVLAPFFLMARRYVHVNWLINNADGRWPNHDRLCVNKFRLRIVSYINATIETWLANTYRHSDIGGMC